MPGTGLCLSRKKHRYEICAKPPLSHWAPHATFWKVSCPQGLPRPQAPWEGALRPQAKAGPSVVLAQSVAPLPRPGEGESGGHSRIQAWEVTGQQLPLDEDVLGGQQRARKGIPGSDRMCPAQDSLLGRSKEATEVGGLWKPECPHTWEPHFPATHQLEIPTGPTLEKQTLGHRAHIPLSKFLAVQASSAVL